MARYSALRRFGLVVVVACASQLAHLGGLFDGPNRSLNDLRMSLSQTSASGGVVFVAIDARSLTGVGEWPWSRATHAALLDRLTDAGALDVLYDVDFAFPSDNAGDAAFEQALIRSGGATYLPVFAQPETSGGAGAMFVNRPLPRFAQQSWPAYVNIDLAPDGLVRAYQMSINLTDEELLSPAALFAGNVDPERNSALINFAIRPDTVPTVSAIDVIQGTFPERMLSGRAVIVGASAIELGDQFSVPVHGAVPGPMIHAMATETLLADIRPRPLRAEPVAALLVLILGALNFGLRLAPLKYLSVAILGLAATEALALSLFRATGMLLPTALLYPAILGFGLWTLSRALSNSRWQHQRSENTARNTLALLERVFDDSNDGIVILDDAGNVVRHSAAALRILGSDQTGRLNMPADLAALVGTVETSAESLEHNVNGDSRLLEVTATRSEIGLLAKPGTLPDQREFTTLVVRDVTQLKDQEHRISFLSNFDERTGTLRRGRYLSFLDLRLREDRPLTVFAVTFPRLKTINMTLGRDVGDAVLNEAVGRLETFDVALSTIARLGGTRFSFFPTDACDDARAEDIAHAICRELKRPYKLAKANAQVDVHVGYAVVPEGAESTPEEVLAQVEGALDRAKTANTPVMPYLPSVWSKQIRAREIERAMSDALANSEFSLLYQPQHRVSDGAMIGAEALIRWHSPSLGQIYPDEFIAIAESTGFINELGAWIFEQAARDASRLAPDLQIAVNVSGIQLQQGNISEDIDRALRLAKLPAHRLCLELTESVLLASTRTIIETMQDLSLLGLTWALDDFGTGYSSMEYLSKMPLDKIKLDRSFTMNLGQDPAARPILHSTSELCRGLGVKLLCEGVETAGQLDVLRAEGCAEAQGYFFGKPMPLNDLSAAHGAHPMQQKRDG